MISKEDAMKDIEEVVKEHGSFSCCVKNLADMTASIKIHILRLPRDMRIHEEKYKLLLQEMIFQKIEKKYLPSTVLDIINKYVSRNLNEADVCKLLEDRYMSYFDMFFKQINENKKP